jgi:hypothetical protein
MSKQHKLKKSMIPWDASSSSKCKKYLLKLEKINSFFVGKQTGVEIAEKNH